MRWPWSRRREAELDEEIRGHLEMAAHDHVTGGESPHEAAFAARREFGNATHVREVTRAMWGGAWLEDAGRDLRLALRSLRRTPTFAVTVVTLLGLSLGAAAAMYGLLDRLLLRAPEQVRNPERLFSPYLTTVGPGGEMTRGFMQWREYKALSDGGAAISAAAYLGPDDQALWRGDAQLQARTVIASVGYFDVLGVHPVLGRFFLPEDSGGRAAPVAVIGYGLWRREFGGARQVLGQVLRLGPVMFTIVGVAPRGFSGATPERVDVWLPAELAGPAAFGAEWQANRFSWQMVARAGSGRTPAQVLAEGLMRLPAAPPDPHYRAGEYRAIQAGSIVPGRAPTGPSTGLRLSYVVGGAATLLAVIALANATGLLLLRALRRRRETAVRVVLGVSRGQLVRTVAVESLVLALLAGVAACLVAAGGGELLRRLLLRVDWSVPVADGRVAAVTFVVSLAAGVLAGLLPGWLAGRPETIAALKSGVRDASPRRGVARGVLVTVQAALSLILLSGLALYFRSFQRARAYDFGPDVDRVLVAELQERTPQWRAPIPPQVSEAVATRVAALPGVRAVALASSLPLWSGLVTAIRAEGVDLFPRFGGPYVVEAGQDYFAATGLGLVRGRYFLDRGPTGPREAVVSEGMARLWRGGSAIGRCLYIGRPPSDCTRIVGVVKDVRMYLSERTPQLTYYVPLAQSATSVGGNSLIVRADLPDRLVPAVRQIVATIAGVRSRDAVRTLRDVVDPQYRRLRQGLTLFGIFAALAVVVAMLGTYSVVAYSVAQREHEFGVRIALGARASSLARLVLGQALRYAGAGLLLGLVLALLGARYVAPLLYQTSPHDPLALLAAALALVLCSAAACIIPARAAARVDPRQALQAE